MPLSTRLQQLNGPNLRVKVATGETIEGPFIDQDTDNIEYEVNIPSDPPQTQIRIIPYTAIQEVFTAVEISIPTRSPRFRKTE